MLTRILLLGLTICCVAQPGELFRDDFSYYPSGWLSAPLGQLNGAIVRRHSLTHAHLHPAIGDDHNKYR